MKIKLFLCLLILSAHTLLYSQSLDDLDRINGFKKFKLGSNLSVFNNLKRVEFPMKLKEVETYEYTGIDVSDFYGVPINKIMLTFYNRKLYQISIGFGTIFKEYSERQFDLVHTNLEGNFGTSYHNVSPSVQAEILNGYIWDAKNVRLENLRFNLAENDGTRNPKYNYINGYILFTQKQIQKEQQRSELEE